MPEDDVHADSSMAETNSSWDVSRVPLADPISSGQLEDGSTFTLREGVELRVERLLGRGGMGSVYLVLDPRLRREAALKLIRKLASRDGRLLRFQRERVITARLDHPGIPAVYEAGRTAAGQDYLLMRYLPGRSLDAHLREVHRGDAPPPLDALRGFLAQLVRVCEAVAYAHSRGVVHRDLKPANVVLGAFGEVCVADWGLARDTTQSVEEDALLLPTPEEAKDAGITVAGSALGTPGYMSPEQARGKDVGPPADVFALGAILSAILTGRPPVSASTGVAAIHQAAAEQFELPETRRPDLPGDLLAIAATALAVDPQDRYFSAQELGADITAWLEGRPVPTHDYGALERLRWRVRQRPGTFAALGAAACALLLGGVVTAFARGEAVRAERGAGVQRARQAALESVSPAPRDIGAALAALGTAQRWHALVPKDADAARRHFDAAVTLGQVALGAAQWELASEAFAEAAGLGLDDDRATTLQAEAKRAASEESRSRLASVHAIISRARDTELLSTPDGYEDTLFDLYKLGHRDTALRLAEEVRGAARALRDAELEVWLSAIHPTPAEAARGLKPLEGLLEAAGRRLAGSPPLPGDEPLFRHAQHRLWSRAVGKADAEAPPGAPAVQFRMLLANRQRDALGLTALRAVELCSEALGRIGLAEPAVAALGEYLEAEADPERCITPCLALARIGGEEAMAHVAAACQRFGVPLTEHIGGRLGGFDFSRIPVADDAPSLIGRGELLLATNQLEDALRDFDGAIARDETLARAWLGRGRVRSLLGDHDAAIADLQRAISIERTPNALFDLGNAHLHAGRIEEAERIFDESYRLGGGVRALLNRGVMRQQLGRHAESREDFARVNQLDPNLDVGWANHGSSAEKLGDHAAAAHLFGEAIRLRPRIPRYWLGRASAHAALGNHEAAISDLREALRLDPSLGRAWSNLGLARLNQGDVDGAIADYTQAIALDPRSAGPHFNRGRALQKKGDLEAALLDLDRAVELEPGDPLFLSGRAVLLLDLGRTKAAEASLRASLAARDDPGVRYNLSQVVRQLGRSRESAEEMARALQGDPSLPMGWFNLGAIRVELGELKSARQALTQALERQPNDPRPRTLRALTALLLGDREDAVADLRRAEHYLPLAGTWLAALGEESETLESTAGKSTWESRLASFHLDRLSAGELIAQARSPFHRAQAHLHIALRAEREGRLDEARKQLRACLDACAQTGMNYDGPHVEQALAKQRLDALR